MVSISEGGVSMNIDDDFQELFKQIVVSQIQVEKSGLTGVPLKALREFHEAAGFKPEQLGMLFFPLPGCEGGAYNYYVGEIAGETGLSVDSVAFYDSIEEAECPIVGESVLYGAIFRDVCNGEALLCGGLMICENGRVIVDVSYSGDIYAKVSIVLAENSMGVQLLSDDARRAYRIWLQDDTVFIAPAMIIFHDGMPS